jgi:HmuY protein
MDRRRYFLLCALLVTSACGGGGGDNSEVDASVDPPMIDAPGCNPATVLPSNYRPIAMVSAGTVQVTTTAGVTSGTIDATAGGITNSADRPYIYVDLRNGVKVEVDDLAARSSTSWDIALKRSSLRINGGDSGAGNRRLAVVQAASLGEVTAAPTSGYASDDFTTEACTYDSLPANEPKTAFGEWYGYDDQMHGVVPKAEVYVLERSDGTRTALRIVTYYGDPAMPMRGAYYGVEWKQLPQ